MTHNAVDGWTIQPRPSVGGRRRESADPSRPERMECTASPGPGFHQHGPWGRRRGELAGPFMRNLLFSGRDLVSRGEQDHLTSILALQQRAADEWHAHRVIRCVFDRARKRVRSSSRITHCDPIRVNETAEPGRTPYNCRHGLSCTSTEHLSRRHRAIRPWHDARGVRKAGHDLIVVVGEGPHDQSDTLRTRCPPTRPSRTRHAAHRRRGVSMALSDGAHDLGVEALSSRPRAASSTTLQRR